MGTKNNPANRGKMQKKEYDGKVVKPVLYMGSHVGHGKYVAVQFEDGRLALDEVGIPIMWDAV